MFTVHNKELLVVKSLKPVPFMINVVLKSKLHSLKKIFSKLICYICHIDKTVVNWSICLTLSSEHTFTVCSALTHKHSL